MMAQKEQSVTSLKEAFTTPYVDLAETPERFLLLLDLPGVSKEGVDLKVRDGELTIVGAPERARSAGDRLLYGEVKHRTFRRTFRLSDDLVDIQKITAHLENGVLSVNLPKRGHRRSRRKPVHRLS